MFQALQHLKKILMIRKSLTIRQTLEIMIIREQSRKILQIRQIRKKEMSPQ